MIVLDTDHLTVLKYRDNAAFRRLNARMAGSTDPDFGTTIVNAEEQLRGWLADIHRQRTVHAQISGYERLSQLIEFLQRFRVLEWETAAADEFERLRSQKIRIGTMDLKIASIALVHNALLLSANTRDFEKVPGLRVESWLAD